MRKKTIKDGVRSYQQASKEWRKTGASHAQGDGLQAMGADLIASRFCMRAPFVYAWGQKHKVNLFHLAYNWPLDQALDLVESALNDRPMVV